MPVRDIVDRFDTGLTYPRIPIAPADDGTPRVKTYRVPSPDAKTGLWLTALWNLGAVRAGGGQMSDVDLERLKLDDDGEKDLYQRVLGPAWDEMIQDGVEWEMLQKIGRDAYVCFASSEQAADALLVAPGNRTAPQSGATASGGSEKAGSRSSQASGVTRARTRGRTSTRSSKTSEPEAAAG